jgi:hypothetical protein
MKAVLFSLTSGLVYQCGKYGVLVLWVVMSSRVHVEAVIGMFAYTAWPKQPSGLL